MNITDIVNRDIVNLTNCESEPIHIPGSIQPHGFLLGLKGQNQVIDFCSANSAEFILLSPEMLLGKSLTEIFDKNQADNFIVYSIENQIDPAKPFVFTLNDIPYNTTVHQSGDTLILELEPFPDGTLDLPNLYSQTKNFVSSMERQSYLPELCADIADQTRNITGYDRVMIYRFDAEYNGEVIAESKREDLESFSGQKYPHTDIPAQARELYIKNQLRMIADINYQPVPILTLNSVGDKDNKSLDLSLSILRSVSPIHVEYLKNMGVGATLTISLLQNNKLWGLIACHHYSPKVLPHYTRLSALLQGHFLTSQIAVREVAEEFEISVSVDKALLDSLELLHENENFIEENFESPSLLKLANATGFVIYHKGKLYKNGNVPSNEELVPLLKFLSENYQNRGLHTEQLIDIYPQGESLSKFAAGIIYHSIAAGTPDGILWLRAERRETINWAGNPHKAVIHNEEGVARLSPRKSFELWLEEVKDKSAAWRKSELGSSSNFAYSIQKHINLRYVRSQENKNRLLNDELKAANKELANLNWISTHDLKEPLRKIQIFASKILDREQPDISAQVKDSVERMRFAAEKMQLLIEDILSYSKAGNMEKVYETVDLNLILQKVLEELNDNIDEKKALITSAELPALSVIPFQIHQLFVNLLSNAIKFSKEEKNPAIVIDVQIVTGNQILKERTEANALLPFYAVSFQDNGIGFEKEYESRIFDVFQRLHPANKYPGTGIGLAICKKIMENHGGYITADSEPGEGSRFTLYFPFENEG
ncbi:ATP-binding protein [Dyadobacter psychrotolerans]|uniref:histidine kinase n=1 Tax=Dyadobacter psychrotolerans TaxID=2541721 RepID=A0A4V2Z3I7_9BACT|nr:ATP-binding protein [Dyadobacter psychrotolerans]TDE12858.1 GAF domain-containing protein [Dyadobacter psychrotolerans]